MRDRISIKPESVTVSLELPWDVAEQLVEQGPAIIDALRRALAQRAAEDENRKRLRRYQTEGAAERIAEWDRLARHIDRELRKRCQQGGESQRTVFQELAGHFGVTPTALRSLHASFSKRRNEAIRTRRVGYIIRLYCLGYSNAEIGRMVRPQIKAGTVGHIIAQNRDVIATLKVFDRQVRTAAEKPSLHSPGTSGNVVALNAAEEAQEARRARHQALGRQLYAEWRQRSSLGEKRPSVLKEFAERHHLNVPYVEHLLAVVRQEERQARDDQVLRLHRQGLKNGAVARRTGLHDRTVARIIRDHQNAAASADKAVSAGNARRLK